MTISASDTVATTLTALDTRLTSAETLKLASPTISPSTGDTTTTFTATDPAVPSGGTISLRQWLLAGTAIGTGTTVVSSAAGALTRQVGGTRADGSAFLLTSAPRTVASATAAATLTFANPTVSIPEGNTGTTTVASVINVARNGETGALTINLTYGGTATGGVDYATAPTSLTVGSGVSSASFDILLNGDTTVEPDETIVISAVEPVSGATASKTITVTNDDAAGARWL